MPPVFGPSVAVEGALVVLRRAERDRACVPSQSAKKLASSPTRHSSITTSAPGRAERRRRACASIAASASASVCRHDDALAGREAVGLDDDRRALGADIGLRRRGVREAGEARRSGCRLAAHSSLVKALEPSSRAAARLGPKALMPAAARSSTMPATSGASGPTTTRSIRLPAGRTRRPRRGRRDRARRSSRTARGAGIARRDEERGRRAGLPRSSRRARARARPSR